MSDLLNLPLHEISGKIKAKAASPVELAKAALAKIQRSEPQLNAYVSVFSESALDDAKRAEKEISAGKWRGPLHGVPVAVKDLFDIKGLPTACGSKVRYDHVAAKDSAVVELLKDAGAVIMGKTETHEFANGVTTPQTSNPWDLSRSPGGSSGGSGATVAARGCFMAIGTDTGGSVRIPSALCGVTGIRPTYGLISRYGTAPLSWSLDTPGPIARSVKDLALSLSVLAKHDYRDPASAAISKQDYTLGGDVDLSGVRIGIPENYFFHHVDAEIEALVRAAVDSLTEHGAELVSVKLPLAHQIQAVQFAIYMAESAAYHYKMLRERADLYQLDEVRAYLEIGSLIPAIDYISAQRLRYRLQQSWRELFAQHELTCIVGPSVPAPAVKRNEQEIITWNDGVRESAINAYVRISAPASTLGMPALSVPCGFTKADMPVGFQLIGKPFGERDILKIGDIYERNHEWLDRLPTAC